jgi:hypothetical protein
MNKLTEFLDIYRLYRKANTRRYSLIAAWRIAVQGLPF